jgi:hypothetical protein
VEVSRSEGLANHAGPESCVVRREAQGEALTGERVGWVLSRESSKVQGADAVASAEGKTGALVKRERARPCVVGDPSMRGSSVYGNREISPLADARKAQRPASGRPEGRSR